MWPLITSGWTKVSGHTASSSLFWVTNWPACSTRSLSTPNALGVNRIRLRRHHRPDGARDTQVDRIQPERGGNCFMLAPHARLHYASMIQKLG